MNNIKIYHLYINNFFLTKISHNKTKEKSFKDNNEHPYIAVLVVGIRYCCGELNWETHKFQILNYGSIY